MAAEPDGHPVEEGDPPFSRWADIKQRFVARLWHDIQNRTEFLLGVALFAVGLIWGVFFE